MALIRLLFDLIYSLSQMLSDRYPLSQFCERVGESFFAIDFDVDAR